MSRSERYLLNMHFFQSKNILVTGAGGFIGSHLTEALAPLCQHVTAMVHYDSRPQWSNLEFVDRALLNQIRVVSGDITDAHFVRRIIHDHRIDVVFHLAALIAIPYSYTAPNIFFQTNVLGTLNVVEACRCESVERVICTSTSECYGTARSVPISEEHPLQAQSPYSASKIGADKVAESYYCAFNTPIVILRPFNTYGPRQSARAIVPTIISQLLSDNPVIKLGSLDPVRDLTYIGDTVAGFLAAAASPNLEGEVINLGVGQGVTIGELVVLLSKLTNIKKEIQCDNTRIRPVKSEVLKLISDNSKAKERMGWEPAVSLEDGLIRTIEFIRSNRHLYKPELYQV